MITVVEFKAKQVGICPLINYTAFFFIKIDLNWSFKSIHKVVNFWSFFNVKNQLNLYNFFFHEEYKTRKLLLVTLFDYFHFWSTLLSEIETDFRQAPISWNQLRWKNNRCRIYNLLPVVCLVLNYTTVIMLLETYIALIIFLDFWRVCTESNFLRKRRYWEVHFNRNF